MKMIFKVLLILGVGFSSFKGFAGIPEDWTVDKWERYMLRCCKKIYMEFSLDLVYDLSKENASPQDLVLFLVQKLFDENIPVKDADAAAEVLKILVKASMRDFSSGDHPENLLSIPSDIAEALGKNVNNDTEEVILKKIEVLTGILEGMDKKDLVTLFTVPQIDKVFETVYSLSEAGFSVVGNSKVQIAAAKLLHKAFIDMWAEEFRLYIDRNMSKTIDIFTSRNLKILPIALKGFASKIPEVRFTMDQLLKRVFVMHWPEHIVLKIASETAREGFSNANPEIRRGVVIFLTATAEAYPVELNSQITSLISNRQKKERNRKTKRAIRKALERLKASAKANESLIRRHEEINRLMSAAGRCEEKWQ